MTENPAVEARLTFLECKLAQAEKQDDVLNEKIDFLEQKYPESTFTHRAQRLVGTDVFLF